MGSLVSTKAKLREALRTKELILLRLVHQAARGVMRNHGVDTLRCTAYFEELKESVYDVNDFNDAGDEEDKDDE